MPASVSSTEIRRERARLQRLAEQTPGVAYVGYRTGQLELRRESPANGIHRVSLTAVAAPGLGDEPMVYYHPVVHRVTDDGERVQRRERFRHPMPATDWLLEAVPDFDLVETEYVNVPDEAVEDAEFPGTGG